MSRGPASTSIPVRREGATKGAAQGCGGGLIFILLVLPWLRVGGKPALLLDFAHGRFAALGASFQAHDAPLFLLIGGAFILTIALISALWGRAWCGWACPQTVFVEGIFRSIERWIEGDALARRRLDDAPMSSQKIFKRVVKWVLFTIAAIAIAHSFLAILIGSDELLRAQRGTPLESWGTFLSAGTLSLILLLDFGWLREQFCLIACPYGRLQSVLMDANSVSVAYDAKRGEPRRGTASSASGDCVDCNRCVKVCPTGIDIRNGAQQLECIACAACIDVCDDVMARLKKPLGLIRHASENELAGKRTLLHHSRVVIYAALLTGVLGALATIVGTRKDYEVMILRTRGEPFQRVNASQGARLTNTFFAEITNHSSVPMEARFALPAQGPARLVSPDLSMTVEPGEVRQLPFAIELPQTLLRDGRASLALTCIAGLSTSEQEVTLVGPFH